MSRIRLAYCQEGIACYLGHLDIMRSFARACRRAGVPIAYSQGFNPHPKLTFGAPLPVGTCGAQEYVDIDLDGDPDPQDVVAALNGMLPHGLVPLKARKVPDSSAALMSILGRARYLVRGGLPSGIAPADFQKVVSSLLDQGETVVERVTSKGAKKRDIRPGIKSLQATLRDQDFVLNMELAAGGRGTVRPDDVLKALAGLGGFELVPREIWRTALLSSEGKLLWDC